MATSHRQSISAIVVASVMGLAAQGVHAETPATPDSAAEVTEVVVTASRLDLLGKAATASEGQVTKEELELRPAYRVGQLLETIPGLVVTLHSGEGKAPQYLARGFNLDHGTDIANFIDDIPINRPTNAHGQGYSDLNFIIPETLAGVDYTKGTYYASIGDFGDVASDHIRLANIIPDQIAVSGGTLGDDAVFVGGTQPIGERARVAVGLTESKVDGPFDPVNDFRKSAALVRFSREGGADAQDFTLMYFKGDGRFITDQPVRAIQEGLIGRFGTLDPSDGNSSERLSVSGHANWDLGDWTVKTGAYYIRSRQTLWNDFTHFLEDPINGDQEQQDETRETFGGQAAGTYKANVFGFDSRTTVGVQGRYDDIYLDRRHTKDRQDLGYCELLDPDGVTAIQVDTGLPDCTADRARVGDVGLYIENATRWTPWFRTNLGLREEIYDGYDHSLLPGKIYSTTAFTDQATLLQPKLNLVFGPWAATEFYISAGRGFHSDDVRGVSGTVPLEDLGGTGTAPIIVKADGAELGIRSDIVPKLHVQIAVFNIRLNSEIVYDQDQGEDQPGPPSDRYGVEVSAQYRPLRWLEFNTDISVDHARFVDTSAADLLNKFGDDGAFIPLAPNSIASFGVLVDNLGPWSGGLQVRALGPYALVADNSERDDGYTETNVNVGYKVGRSLKLDVDIFNLFNTKANAAAFFYTTDIHDGLGPTADHQIHPLEPISARVRLTAYF